MNKVVKITITESETIFVDQECDVEMSYHIVCQPVSCNGASVKPTEIIIERDQTNTIVFSKSASRV
jgi:hypothetical protein